MTHPGCRCKEMKPVHQTKTQRGAPFSFSSIEYNNFIVIIDGAVTPRNGMWRSPLRLGSERNMFDTLLGQRGRGNHYNLPIGSVIFFANSWHPSYSSAGAKPITRQHEQSCHLGHRRFLCVCMFIENNITFQGIADPPPPPPQSRFDPCFFCSKNPGWNSLQLAMTRCSR